MPQCSPTLFQYTAYALPFLLREEQLSSAGVDLDSCLHFLFELYAQWMRGGPSAAAAAAETPPLVLLTATVRSTLVLSDVFTETGHFRLTLTTLARQYHAFTKFFFHSLRWMGECFLEVLRVHPAEDESLNSLLTLGICKALAITGCADPWQA